MAYLKKAPATGFLLIAGAIFLMAGHANSQETQESAPPMPNVDSPSPQAAVKPRANPPATQANVPYGAHERQVLDFWKAPGDQPTPVVFFMHGGGWVRGDKSEAQVGEYLAAGISVVSINYRFSWQAQLAGVNPPLEWPMRDGARALQFVRAKAEEWGIDKKRIGVSGQSAGACTILWLAFHPDLADPSSTDAIARESTRPWCAAAFIAQTSLDPLEMKEWTPNSRYGGGAFGFMDPHNLGTRDTRFGEFLAHRAEILPWIKEYSPIEHASAGDPPVYLLYNAAPALGKEQKDPTHTANFGVKLEEKLKSVGVECELVYPGSQASRHKSVAAFLIESLRAD
jgi:acetyl esterase/lipase